MKKHKNKIIAGIVIIIVLAFAFWYGGDAPALHGWVAKTEKTDALVNSYERAKDETNDAKNTVSDIKIKEENPHATEENKPQKQDGMPMTAAEKIAFAEKIAESVQNSEEEQKPFEEIAPEETVNEEQVFSDKSMQSDTSDCKEKENNINKSSENEKNKENLILQSAPIPIEPENVVITDKELTCTLSVKCDTILQNIAWLDRKKIDIVPQDGVVFSEKTVTFYEGESVFNLLLREMKRNNIHMEFENVPMYNSAYIEGIANIYEFDCGELSGWMYKVNGWFPNYGCSRYQLKAGDRVEWVYTCDLGVDVGGNYFLRKSE